jgi:AcrR family transcriptional regulator
MSLRERKKEATRYRLMHTALDLFEERGFDNVTVAEVADAADVSRMTVFNYFPVKEDLVAGVAEDHIPEPANVVRNRAPGQTPHDAMLAFFLDGLARREPITGLSDHPDVLRRHRLVERTPALMIRFHHYWHETERLLAEALVEESGSELASRLIAAQILGAQQVLVRENRRRIVEEERADDIHPDAVDNARHAYRLLSTGLGRGGGG